MVSMSRKMPPPSGTTQLEQEQQNTKEDLQDAQICELCEMSWKCAESRFATIIEQLQRQVAEQQEQQQHQQTDDNTVQAPINLAKFQDIEIDKAQGLEQLSQTNDEASIAVGKSLPTSKEVVIDEPQTQLQGPQGLHQLSQTNDENSLPVRKSVPTSKEVLVDEQQTQPQDSYETTQEKNTQEDFTVRVDLDKDVNETIEAEEYPVPSALDETKNPSPSTDEIIRRASAPASESLSDTEKLEIIAAIAQQVEKNPEVVEVVPLSIIPPNWNVASTTGGLLMLDKNECTTPPPAISKKAEVLDEGLTKSGKPPQTITQGTISRYIQPGSNKEELEFTFYERLAIELEEQGLSVGSLIVEKAVSNIFHLLHSFYNWLLKNFLMISPFNVKNQIYFPVHYREHYFLYVLLVQEKKVLAFNNLHAKDLDYYKPTKDLLVSEKKIQNDCHTLRIIDCIFLILGFYVITVLVLQNVPAMPVSTHRTGHCSVHIDRGYATITQRQKTECGRLWNIHNAPHGAV
ncbi:OLC1v1031154C1 [Oldenlandia corymbosa var. corymbosa]|uniref:OLC1v1031154C1 n=1 Tax=Oldenlandia corymbosa var. corymbosa TaxID=529605 RepID=A0AAV1CIS8_OLDCO|nr:OLC1v1031154C1 [Oldenlandia corymbosa var. corymbosa]